MSESYLIFSHFDLVTPDGVIYHVQPISPSEAAVEVHIGQISPAFIGFSIDKKYVLFNLKSTLAQLGFHAKLLDLELNKNKRQAILHIRLFAKNSYAQAILPLLHKDCVIGKLFAQDESRKVKNPEYLMRMFGRCDREGRPLLSFGHHAGHDELILEKIKGFTYAFLPIKKGIVTYKPSVNEILSIIPTLLTHKSFPIRIFLRYLQEWKDQDTVTLPENDVLLVRTEPLYVRTVFARVVDEKLPRGYHHTAANILQPDTLASGDIYEFYGSSDTELKEIPLEFYTLEPHREYVFFHDRDQLQASLERSETLFKAFKTAPKSAETLAAVFISKGTQLFSLSEKDWIQREVTKHDLPGIEHPQRQATLVKKYIEEQPAYPFVKAMEDNFITSQGILLSRYLPSPMMKRFLLSQFVQRCIKGIYFQYPSMSHPYFFSHEDRGFLSDLSKFGIPVYWVDQNSKQILQYVYRTDKDTGMFVPLNKIESFLQAIFFGVYGSNLIAGSFEIALQELMSGLIKMQKELSHPLLSATTPIALVTGGGPGAMEVGNRVAKNTGILSCANIVDFRKKNEYVNEQKQNPYIEAKMTYRIDKLIERQAEFRLDFPIFLMGGIGMDFEFTLEEVRRKVGSGPITPVLLFGSHDYWKSKITSRYLCNIRTQTTKGSEWVSNCFYCIQNAQQGLEVYRKFFKDQLPIGPDYPAMEEGFFSFEKNGELKSV